MYCGIVCKCLSSIIHTHLFFNSSEFTLTCNFLQLTELNVSLYSRPFLNVSVVVIHLSLQAQPLLNVSPLDKYLCSQPITLVLAYVSLHLITYICITVSHCTRDCISICVQGKGGVYICIPTYVLGNYLCTALSIQAVSFSENRIHMLMLRIGLSHQVSGVQVHFIQLVPCHTCLRNTFWSSCSSCIYCTVLLLSARPS